MFNKNNDTWLKITNMILIIIATISLGLGIGNNFYKDKNDYKYCGLYSSMSQESQNNFVASCEYLNATEEYNSFKTMCTSYSVFGIALASLIICNITKKNQ